MQNYQSAKYFEGNEFRKVQRPDLALTEYTKSLAARQIALQSDLFKVPQVLEYSPETGTLVFERLHDLVPLQVALCMPDLAIPAARKAGGILGIVHRELRLPKDHELDLPQELALDGASTVFLHGDYNLHNVCISRVTHQLVVLDWSMTQLFGGRATIGPRFFDVAWFVYNIFSHSGLRWPRITTPAACADAFMDGYLAAIPPADASGLWPSFSSYMREMVALLRQQRRSQLGPWVFWLETGAFRSLERWLARPDPYQRKQSVASALPVGDLA